jgi:hypothetical protein
MLEITIERQFVSQCESIGIRAFKFELKGIKGAPDRIVFLPNGKSLLIEFKRPGASTSKHQDEFIDWLNSLGHETIISDNWEYPFNLVRKYSGK